MKPHLEIIVMLALIAALMLVLTAPQKTVLTPSEIAKNADAYVGTLVTVRGTADASGIVCTLAVCPPADPCCNSCGGALVITDGVMQLALEGTYQGKHVGCGGTNCDITCYPLAKGGQYTVNGTLNHRYDAYAIALEHYREEK
ncbi:MAG: hypothetical protein HYY37_04755 [Candidatus Aenigmarchaeota archaeon]|nr:hypothetical protein [Candidatus Aenigmarchaeota archaeon]